MRSQCYLTPNTGERALPQLWAAKEAGTWFTYPKGMKGWVDHGVGYISRWYACLQTVTDPAMKQLTESWTYDLLIVSQML